MPPCLGGQGVPSRAGGSREPGQQTCGNSYMRPRVYLAQ